MVYFNKKQQKINQNGNKENGNQKSRHQGRI